MSDSLADPLGVQILKASVEYVMFVDPEFWREICFSYELIEEQLKEAEDRAEFGGEW